jgi:MULE transposase domain
MTRRRAADYVAVLKYIKFSLFPNIELAWQALVSDFEYALIKAMKEIFPAVFHRGCEFHWAQALFKKVTRIILNSY